MIKFVMFWYRISYLFVACYVQFVIGHDEGNVKGIWIAKYLQFEVCTHVCVWGGGGRERNKW